jgi:hypothetical protein
VRRGYCGGVARRRGVSSREDFRGGVTVVTVVGWRSDCRKRVVGVGFESPSPAPATSRRGAVGFHRRAGGAEEHRAGGGRRRASTPTQMPQQDVT